MNALSPNATTPATSSAPSSSSGSTTGNASLKSFVRAEWIKLRSVRSNVVALVAAGAVLVLIGTLFSSLAGSDKALPPGATSGTDSLSMSFGAMNMCQLVLGVLGAVFVAGEYATGMIRSMFTAAASRSNVLWAKAIVLGGASWIVMTIASFAVFFTGQAAYAGTDATYSLSDPGVLRAVLGGGVYGAGIVLMGLALGFILRSTAAAIGTLIGTLMILPGLVGFLPDSIGESVGKFLPSTAGQAFLSVSGGPKLLSPGAGFAVFAGWAIGLLGIAVFMLHRRDA
jgi:ABC-2 type transport system permease protein